jgi:hypothetical protein
MVPISIMYLEELCEHCPGKAPRTRWKAGNLRQHRIIVLQDPTAPKVEEE